MSWGCFDDPCTPVTCMYIILIKRLYTLITSIISHIINQSMQGNAMQVNNPVDAIHYPVLDPVLIQVPPTQQDYIPANAAQHVSVNPHPSLTETTHPGLGDAEGDVVAEAKVKEAGLVYMPVAAKPAPFSLFLPLPQPLPQALALPPETQSTQSTQIPAAAQAAADKTTAPRPATCAAAPSSRDYRPHWTHPSHSPRNSTARVVRSTRRLLDGASRRLARDPGVLLPWLFLGLVFPGWGLSGGFREFGSRV